MTDRGRSCETPGAARCGDDVQSLRRLLGLRAAAVPSVSGPDKGDGRVGGGRGANPATCKSILSVGNLEIDWARTPALLTIASFSSHRSSVVHQGATGQLDSDLDIVARSNRSCMALDTDWQHVAWHTSP